MTEKRLAIIGGTGFASVGNLKVIREHSVDTPFGSCSSVLKTVELEGVEVIILFRHGSPHRIPPHKVNYLANIWALHEVGITHVIGVTAVGGINRTASPKKIIIPDQIIDYTYDRKHTFFEQNPHQVTHIDFTEPFCHELREVMLLMAAETGLDVLAGATYGVTQGPRLETAAEIRRMARDGCDVVGMTAMPEASLAREMGICYAVCSLSINWAAGCGSSKEMINLAEMEKTIEQEMLAVRQLLGASVRHFHLTS